LMLTDADLLDAHPVLVYGWWVWLKHVKNHPWLFQTGDLWNVGGSKSFFFSINFSGIPAISMQSLRGSQDLNRRMAYLERCHLAEANLSTVTGWTSRSDLRQNQNIYIFDHNRTIHMRKHIWFIYIY
jgi:hypothetical protein